jgi:hypothetical protein
MRNWLLLALILVVLFGGFSSASATHPASEYGILFSFSASNSIKVSNFLYISNHLQKL